MELYNLSAIIKKNTTNNAIEIRTGKKFNLTIIDIDNVYLAFDLFVLCFQRASIITKTKKGYHFYYRYCDKLKNDIKQNLGYDIKTNTNVTAPPSFYEYHDSENSINVIPEKKIFTYKFVKVFQLGKCNQEVIDFINPQNKQQLFDILDDKKLTNKIFMSIIDLIPLTKLDDVSSWFKFGIVCWLLGYPCE